MHVTIETAFLTPRGNGLLKLSCHFLAFSNSCEIGTAGRSG